MVIHRIVRAWRNDDGSVLDWIIWRINGWISGTTMKRGGCYTPAWQSPNDADRKLGVVRSNEQTGNEAGTLLHRRDGKVVPVCVHIEDNGLCTDDDVDDDDEDRPSTHYDEKKEEEEKDELVATAGNHVDEVRRQSADLDCVERGDVHCPASPSSSSSSISGDLRGYNDSSLKTSVYDLPPELDGSPSSVLPRRRVQSESSAEPRRSRVEGLANDALSAVVRSCRSPPTLPPTSSRPQEDDSDDIERLSSVSAPAIFVVSDAKQLVIFSVDRTARSSELSPVARVPPSSHSDHALNR